MTGFSFLTAYFVNRAMLVESQRYCEGLELTVKADDNACTLIT